MSVEADLKRYAALLIKWNAVQNLVSRETIADLWPRHIEDSLETMSWVRPSDRQVLDLGSGGGFPAIPMAIASRGVDRHFTLLEPIAKKAAFLRAVARELDLPVTIHTSRAEQFDSRETFHLVTSRALAPLPNLLTWIARFFVPGSHILLHKGRSFGAEIDEASALFAFDLIVHPGVADAGGVILEIANLRAKPVA